MKLRGDVAKTTIERPEAGIAVQGRCGQQMHIDVSMTPVTRCAFSSKSSSIVNVVRIEILARNASIGIRIYIERCKIPPPSTPAQIESRIKRVRHHRSVGPRSRDQKGQTPLLGRSLVKPGMPRPEQWCLTLLIPPARLSRFSIEPDRLDPPPPKPDATPAAAIPGLRAAVKPPRLAGQVRPCSPARKGWRRPGQPRPSLPRNP